jgi:protein tyrosine phosphatase
MNPFIQNVAWADIPKGDHFDCGDRAMLIQIVDPATSFPIPKHNFKTVHQYEFLDVEEDEKSSLSEFAMQPWQAKQIAALLQEALQDKRPVVVHCFAGVCRSGAVAEVGVMMGFQDTRRFRQPNTWVKKLLMKELGWTYEEQFEKQPPLTMYTNED